MKEYKPYLLSSIGMLITLSCWFNENMLQIASILWCIAIFMNFLACAGIFMVKKDVTKRDALYETTFSKLTTWKLWHSLLLGWLSIATAGFFGYYVIAILYLITFSVFWYGLLTNYNYFCKKGKYSV